MIRSKSEKDCEVDVEKQVDENSKGRVLEDEGFVWIFVKIY